jgi:hypothetical protein
MQPSAKAEGNTEEEGDGKLWRRVRRCVKGTGFFMGTIRLPPRGWNQGEAACFQRVGREDEKGLIEVRFETNFGGKCQSDQ